MRRPQMLEKLHIIILLFFTTLEALCTIFVNVVNLKVLLLIVTFLTLISGLIKELGTKKGLILGTIGGFLITVLCIQQSVSFVFLGTVEADTQFGNLVIDCESILLEYSDENNAKYPPLTEKVLITADDCEEIVLKNIEYGITDSKYKIEDGKIIFSKIPTGFYSVEVKLKDKVKYCQQFSLGNENLVNKKWEKTINVKEMDTYKSFDIELRDSEHRLLKGYKCDILLDGYGKKINGIVSDSSGRLPYHFIASDSQALTVFLYYDTDNVIEDDSENEEIDGVYTKNFSVSNVEDTAYLIFDTPKVDNTIAIREHHESNSTLTSVYYQNWDWEEDCGLDGKRHYGGLKVTISDTLIAITNVGEKSVVSQIFMPLDMDGGTNTFSGCFVLEEEMFGSKSNGEIRILINDEEKFSTGLIDGNTMKSFPFNIEFSNASIIIIEAKVNLVGTDFVYGIVEE